MEGPPRLLQGLVALLHPLRLVLATFGDRVQPLVQRVNQFLLCEQLMRYVELLDLAVDPCDSPVFFINAQSRGAQGLFGFHALL